MPEPTGSTRSVWPPFLAAAAIGAALTLVHARTVNGGRLEAWDWYGYVAQFLFLTAPFGLVALVGARSWRAWAAPRSSRLVQLTAGAVPLRHRAPSKPIVEPLRPE